MISDLYLTYNDNYFIEAFVPKFRSINLKAMYWMNLQVQGKNVFTIHY